MKTFVILTLALLSVAAAAPSPRDEKVLSLFSVVNFKNDVCQPTATGVTDIKGTCFSSTECTSKGGTNSGKCASGFGVCCTFVIDTTTGGTVSQDNTVISNNRFPTPLTAATQNVIYTVNAVSTDICMLKFDFINFDLGFNDAAGATDGACLDTFTVVSPSSRNPPILCGKNTGLHLFSDVGRSSQATTVTVATDANTARNRIWRIQISQIECSSADKPPTGCAQFFTASSGQFESFNFQGGRLLQNQNYNMCFKANGMCRMTIKTDLGTVNPDPFLLQNVAAGLAAAAGVGVANCNLGSLRFDGNSFCGGILNMANAATASGTVSFNAPFTIGVFVPVADIMISTGFRLLYSTSNTMCN